MNAASKKFFHNYAKNVDNANRQAFWALSDSIVLEIFKKHIPRKTTKKPVILDAGGGTARWAITLHRTFKSRVLVYDLSEDMLSQATKNIREAGLDEYISIILGNLQDMRQIKDRSVDYVVSIYNPISFVPNTSKVFDEFHRVLKKGGKALVMGQGYHNAIASKINNYITSPRELRGIEKSGVARWAKHVPPLRTFSFKSLKNIFRRAGFSLVAMYGVPIFAQPGSEDFDPNNIKKSRISKALENQAFFRAVFQMEMKYNGLPELVDRGMNIIAVGKK